MSKPGPAMAALAAVVRPSTQRPTREPASEVRERAQMLSRASLFSGLSKRNLYRLARLATDMHARAGAMIVQAGQPGRTFHVIVEGRARVVHGPLTSGRKIGGLGAGAHFGELALLDGGARTASIVAETPIHTIRLSRSAFREMLKKEPDVAIHLLETMASILRRESSRPSE